MLSTVQWPMFPPVLGAVGTPHLPRDDNRLQVWSAGKARSKRCILDFCFLTLGGAT